MCDPRLAGRLATQLFGCYRASEANDPETYVTAAAALLSRYPEAVARQVCDPVRGLPSTSKFLPAIAEIREACEREMVWHDAVLRRDRVREQTLAGRRDGHKAPIGSAEHTRTVKSFAELRAAMEARTPAPAKPKPFTLLVNEEKPLFVDRPLVNTAALANYLDGMRAKQDDAAMTAEEAWARAEGQSR